VNTTRDQLLLQLPRSVPYGSLLNGDFSPVQASWRAGAVKRVSSERRSIRPSRPSSLLQKRCRGAHESEQGRIRATGMGAQPNRRLELAPPVVVELHL